jgi:tetratricopeptide (TPR) repeat protein
VQNHGAAKLVQADALAKRGDIDLAVEAYEAAYGLMRTEPTALVHGARACLANKRLTTALAFADRATQTFPKWGPAWEIAGDIALASNDKPAARDAYKKALAAEGPVDKTALRKKLAQLK